MIRTVLLSLLFAVSWAGVSWADAVSPDVFACNSLSLGDSCMTIDGVAGTCQKSTCYQKDMEHWDRDAGGYPPTIPVECLECLPTTSDEDGSGCAVGKAGVVAPWLLAGIFAACVTLLRRRPN